MFLDRFKSHSLIKSRGFFLFSSLLIFFIIQPIYGDSDFELGIKNLQNGNYEEAIKKFDDVLDNEPNFLPAILSKGIALYEMGEDKQALEYFNRAIEIDPDNISALNNLSIIYLANGDFEQSKETVDYVLSLDPQNSKALQINNDIIKIQKLNQSLQEGLKLANDARYDDAIKKFDSILETDPENIPALTNKGASLNYLSKWVTAIEYHDKVIELEPENIDALFNKAIALYNIREFNDSIQTLEKILEIYPEHWRAERFHDAMLNAEILNSVNDEYIDTGAVFLQISVWDRNHNLISYTESEKIHVVNFEDFREFVNQNPDKIQDSDPGTNGVFIIERDDIENEKQKLTEIKIHQIGEHLGVDSPISLTRFNPYLNGTMLLAEHNAYYVERGDNLHLLWTVLLPTEE